MGPPRSDPRKDPPFQPETNRTLWIGWGTNGLSLGLQIVVGGVFFGYLFILGSILMVLRGWKPGWFADHVQEQPIAGIPYRRNESPNRWIVAILSALLLSVVASWAHQRIFPEKPDLAKTMLDGVRGLLEKKQAAPQIPDMTIQAIKNVDSYLAGKDESDLDQLFGTGEMLAVNILYERDRIIHYQNTGDKDFAWWPKYAKDGTLTLDIAVMGKDLKKQGGGYRYDSDPNRVYGVIVPKQRLDGKKRLALYETSIGAPSILSASIKGLRDALDQNEQILIHVLDEAMRKDKNYFLLYDDDKSDFWHAIDAMGRDRFVALKPNADAIRKSAQVILGIR